MMISFLDTVVCELAEMIKHTPIIVADGTCPATTNLKFKQLVLPYVTWCKVEVVPLVTVQYTRERIGVGYAGEQASKSQWREKFIKPGRRI